MSSFILKLLKIKWKFKKPPQKKFLIYDKESKSLASFFFNEDDCHILNIRYEEINLYVLVITFFVTGFSKMKDNYKRNYCKIVDPFIIFSTFQDNYSFFRLKNIYSKAKYICIHEQNSDLRFFRSCENYYKNNKEKLRADFMFVSGQYYKKKFSNYIDSKIISIGGFKNNFFMIDKKKNEDNNSILFISQIRAKSEKQIVPKYKVKIDNEIKIVKALLAYCNKKNYKLKIAAKSTADNLDFYKRKFGKGNYTIYFRKKNITPNEPAPYDLVNRSSLIVFTNSTLGLEALIKGIKGVAFPPEQFPIEDHVKKFSRSGPFWSENFDEKILEKYLNQIKEYSDDEWKKIVNENIGDLIEYDPMNSKLVKTMNDLNIKTLLN